MTLATPSLCSAHASERGFILLLPTGHFTVAGIAVVLLTFILVVVKRLPSVASKTLRIFAIPDQATGMLRVLVGGLSLLTCIILISAGYVGSRDPLLNPLPTFVWSIWWVGLTLLHAVFGNLWLWLNPWRVLFRCMRFSLGLCGLQLQHLRYPRWLAYWPSVLAYSLFVWFELIHPAPQDPYVLANVIVGYSLWTLSGLFLFGEKDWLHYGDPFSVFFRFVSLLSFVSFNDNQCVLRWPGSAIQSQTTLSTSAVLFIVMMIAGVSFDGLARTFFWMSILGENPLEHPGRTVLMFRNTIGLVVVSVVAVVLLYICRQTCRFVEIDCQRYLSRITVALIPIAFGYHFAHYGPQFLIDGQYAIHALSDPFGDGRFSFIQPHWSVTSSLLTHHRSVEVIWYVQVFMITAAHVVAVILSHSTTQPEMINTTRKTVAQLPVLVLMLGYTWLGLWLLSTPIAV